MKGKLKPKPIRCEADYDSALAEVERLWDAKLGTPDGDRFEILVTLIEAYEDKHYPMGEEHSGWRSHVRRPSP